MPGPRVEERELHRGARGGCLVEDGDLPDPVRDLVGAARRRQGAERRGRLTERRAGLLLRLGPEPGQERHLAESVPQPQPASVHADAHPRPGGDRLLKAEGPRPDEELGRHAFPSQVPSERRRPNAAWNRAVVPSAGLSAVPVVRSTRESGGQASGLARRGSRTGQRAHPRATIATGIARARTSSVTYSARPKPRPKRTTRVCLPAFASVSRSRRLLTTRIIVPVAPTATAAGHTAG